MEVIYPMFSMVIVTALVGLMTAYSRIKSAYAGEVDPRYFRLMSKYEVTDTVAKLGRNFDNLFEVPVLFYVAGVTALTLRLDSQIFLVLAWLFVILRIIHTAIHLTYNHPLHRFIPFLLSFLCAVGMWINIVVLVSVK
ncbi:MAPEG family protein [bacterium]|nr:MAPEG family protein [bacterium]